MGYDPYEELEAAIYEKACEDYVDFFYAPQYTWAHFIFESAERYILSEENMVQNTISGKEMTKILARKAKEKYGKRKWRWKQCII